MKFENIKNFSLLLKSINCKMKGFYYTKKILISSNIKLIVDLIKIMIFIIILYFYKINNSLFFNYIYIKDKFLFLEKKYYLDRYLILKDISLFANDSMVNEEKRHFFKFLSQETGRKIKFVDTIFFSVQRRFGNALSNLNKLIFYCEIIGCKRIILDNKIYWFIKRKIVINKKITISVANRFKFIKSNSTILYFNSSRIYNYFYKIKPEIKINYLKFEIIKNLPKVKLSNDSLFIHFRSGDIFNKKYNRWYSQPPLCFYKKILNNYNYNEIYIISKDNNNPVIQKLINNYPNIKYLKNNLKGDISYLINAFNIVASISSFLISIIQLNFNLNNLWDYNIYKVLEKLRHFHYDLYKLPDKNFTLYRMEPSNNYIKLMYRWKCKRKQKKLMLKEKCINSFSIIKYK